MRKHDKINQRKRENYSVVRKMSSGQYAVMMALKHEPDVNESVPRRLRYFDFSGTPYPFVCLGIVDRRKEKNIFITKGYPYSKDSHKDFWGEITGKNPLETVKIFREIFEKFIFEILPKDKGSVLTRIRFSYIPANDELGMLYENTLKKLEKRKEIFKVRNKIVDEENDLHFVTICLRNEELEDF